MRIGELARKSGATPSTLRYYEEAGLLPEPGRTAGGYRNYTPDAIGIVQFIKRGQAAALTLAQVKRIIDIRGTGQAPCDHVRDQLDRSIHHLDQQIAERIALRDTITHLRQAAEHTDPKSCASEDICRYL